MSVILVFVALVLVGDALAVGICFLIEQVSKSAALLVFFALYILVFWAAWWLAVQVTERYLIRRP